MRLPLSSALRVIALGALAALSLPGVRAARAEADLVPPAKLLFAWDAAPTVHRARPTRPASCGANPAVAMRLADANRQAAMARIAKLMGAEPGGDAQPLDGRGHSYPVRRDPNVELYRIQQEAQRLRAERAAGTR